jgi:hypothetical protein
MLSSEIQAFLKCLLAVQVPVLGLTEALGRQACFALVGFACFASQLYFCLFIVENW